MSTLAQKLAYNANLKHHLAEMAILSGATPGAADLLSLEQTEQARARLVAELPGMSTTFKIDFADKLGDRFARFVERLHAANASPVLIWTDNAKLCGLLAIDSIRAFNFGFDFDALSDGILTLVTTDMQDSMLLDFSLDQRRGTQVLEIVLTGANWPSVTY